MVLREQLDHRQRGDLTSLLVWRKNFTEFSIQDIHSFNHLRGGIGPHNSQWHKLENNTIDPYLQLFKSLAGFFDEIANEKKFAYVPDQKLRERLKNAQPYLTHDGRVPTMIDLVEIFEGIKPVNPLYTKAEKITDELLAEFSEALASTFRWVGIQNMTNNKETWDQIKKTKPMKDLEEKELVKLLQSVLLGETTPTEEQIRYVAAKYTECPMVRAYRTLVDQPLPEEMENTYSKLFELVHH